MAIMDLRQLQQQLGAAVFPPTAEKKTSATVLAQIKDQHPLSNLERIQIYQNNITASHHQALITIFQVTYQIVGKRLFLQWANAYYYQKNTNLADLNHYGEYFPALIQQQCQHVIELNDFLYLADLAQLEYCWHQSYYSADDPSFDFAVFEQYAQQAEQLFFQRSHSLAVLETLYPILSIWQKHQNNSSIATVEALQQCEFLCIYRHNQQIEICRIDAAIYQFLRDCPNYSLAQLAQNTITAQGLNDLPHLINQKWITAVTQQGVGYCA